MKNKGQFARILDPHEESRAAHLQAKIICQKLRNLIGTEQAEIVAQAVINNSLNEYNQLDPQKIVRLLVLELSKAKLTQVKADQPSRYFTIRNISHYDRKGKNNRAQILGELLVKAEFETIEQVKAEFPHLWNR